jgi:hypothetical protein
MLRMTWQSRRLVISRGGNARARERAQSLTRADSQIMRLDCSSQAGIGSATRQARMRPMERQMTTYTVSYSRAHHDTSEIGQYDTLDEAIDAAREAGALGDGQRSGQDYVYDVAGHEGDDDYAIWIEAPRHRRAG